jgi:hypothetical protein
MHSTDILPISAWNCVRCPEKLPFSANAQQPIVNILAAPSQMQSLAAVGRYRPEREAT